jgi:hypothetical protein
MTMKRVRVAATTATVLTGLAMTGVAAAAEHDDTDGGVTIDISLDEVVDKLGELVDILSDFTGTFSEAMTDALFSVFWQPFLDLLHAAVQFVAFMLAWMPDTTMPELLAVHHDVYLLSLGLGAVGFVVIGLLYIGAGPFTLPFRRLRPLIPKLLLALVFGGLAPWLLAPVVDLSEAIALALAPQDPDTTAMVMMGGELVLIAAVQAVVLLAVLIVLGMTKIFVVFGVAAAPLLAVLWAVPFRFTQTKADALIGVWWACLLVGPFNMIVFRLSLALLSFDGFDAASWILGLAGTVLMIGLPYILVQAGVAAAAPAMAAARGAARTVSRHVDPWHRNGTDRRQTTLDEHYESVGGGQAAGPTPAQHDENRFDKDAILDHGDDDD